jgi:hypothetical protein
MKEFGFLTANNALTTSCSLSRLARTQLKPYLGMATQKIPNEKREKQKKGRTKKKWIERIELPTWTRGAGTLVREDL